MQASTSAQQALLLLAEFELALRRTKSAIAALLEGAVLAELRQKVRDNSEEYLAARNTADNLEVEIRRLADDLALVETRSERDQKRLGTLGNPREFAALESEIATLKARVSKLETEELDLLEQKDAVSIRVAEIESVRADLNAKLQSAESEASSEAAKLQSKTSVLEEQIRATRAGLNQALLEAYDKKSARSLGVARIENQVCGACHLALTPTAYSALVTAADDVLGVCPNCEAFLVR